MFSRLLMACLLIFVLPLTSSFMNQFDIYQNRSTLEYFNSTKYLTYTKSCIRIFDDLGKNCKAAIAARKCLESLLILDPATAAQGRHDMASYFAWKMVKDYYNLADITCGSSITFTDVINWLSVIITFLILLLAIFIYCKLNSKWSYSFDPRKTRENCIQYSW